MKKLIRKLVDRLPLKWIEKIMAHGLRDPEAALKNLGSVDPDLLEDIGKRAALEMFRSTTAQVPAYREFLKRENVDPASIVTFEDFLAKVPVMDKDNYIKKAERYPDLLADGGIREVQLLIRSSGHSGKATTWARGKKELKKAKLTATLGMQMLENVEHRSSFIVNALSLGSWVGGITFSRIAGEFGTMVNTGPNADEILDMLKDFGRDYDQVIIAGYPPFLKIMVDKGIDMGLKWKDYNVHFICGGEGFSEGWRDYMLGIIGGTVLQAGSQRIVSVFGASDLGVTGYQETMDSILIRRYAVQDCNFRKGLFGDSEREPMLFQYNPTQFQITTNAEHELIFTTLDPDTIQPLVKYNIHDVGGVLTVREMQALLDRYNIPLKMNYNLPFIFVGGRSDGTIKVCGTLVFTENLKQAIYADKELAANLSGKFKMGVEEKDLKAEFWVDLELGEKTKWTLKDDKKIALLIQKGIADVNYSYANKLKLDPQTSTVRVRLYEYGKFPVSKKLKNDYV